MKVWLESLLSEVGKPCVGASIDARHTSWAPTNRRQLITLSLSTSTDTTQASERREERMPSLMEDSATSTAARSARSRPKEIPLSKVPIYERYRPDPKMSAGEVIGKWLLKPMTKTDLKDGFLYVYWYPGNFGLVKIGYTTHPIEKRLSEWRHRCKHDVRGCLDNELCSRVKIRNVTRLENLVHAELREYRVRETGCQCGSLHIEWFKTSEPHVKAVIQKWTRFVSSMERYENRIGGQLLKRRTPDEEVAELCQPLSPPSTFGDPSDPRRKARLSQGKLRARSEQPSLRRSARLQAKGPPICGLFDTREADVRRKKRRVQVLLRADTERQTSRREPVNSSTKGSGNGRAPPHDPREVEDVETLNIAVQSCLHPLLDQLLTRLSPPRWATGLKIRLSLEPKLQVNRYADCRDWSWQLRAFVSAILAN